MLKLCAVAYADGYAVYQEKGQTYLLRPPYIPRNKVATPEAAVARAITLHGYTPVEKEFVNLSALIQHLETARIQCWRDLGQSELSEEEIRAFLHRLPLQTARQYLDRVQHKMIPDRKWEPAQDVLLHLLVNPKVQADADLRQRCVVLLEMCRAGQKQRDAMIQDLLEDDIQARFPTATNRYGLPTITQSRENIRRDRQVLLMS